MEYTQNGARPDLAAVEVNAPEGYIANQVMPIVPVTEKTGVIYYATVTADSAAQTSRTAGAAPSGTQISDSNTTFSCLERCKRGSVTPDEVKTMGGIDKADQAGARWAKRQVMNAYEAMVCAEVLGLTASATFDAAKLQTQAQVAIDAIARYEGQTALIASTTTLRRMVQGLIADDDLGPVFARLITGTDSIQAAKGLSFASWLNGLSMYLGVDKVLAGSNAVWGTATYVEKFAMMKLDTNSDPLSHKWNPVFGKSYQFLPDGAQPWYIESVGDLVAKNNHYDAFQWIDTVALNTGAAYIFDGVV